MTTPSNPDSVEGESLVVLDPKTTEVDPDWAEQLSNELTRLLAGYPRFHVMAASELKALVLEVRDAQSAGCDMDTACLSRIAQLSQARWLVLSSLGRVGSQWVVSINLFDAEEGTPHGRITRDAPDFAAIRSGLPKDLRELLGDAPETQHYAHPHGRFSCAVLDLAPHGVSPDTAKNLTQVLSSAIKQLDGAQVISRDDVVALVEMQATEQGLGCDDLTCIAQLGGALGVDELVIGSVGKLGASYILSLRLISIRKAAVENRVSETFTGDEEQLLGASRQAVLELFGADATDPGAVVVSSSESGATITLDGTGRGVTPLPPIRGLRPGRHTLRVSKGGYFDFASDVYVAPGATNAQWVRLEEMPQSWYQKWWVWTLAAGIVAGGVTAAVLLTQENSGAVQVNAGVPGAWR